MRKGLFVATVVGICFWGLALPPYPPPDIKAQVLSVVDGGTIYVKLLQVADKYASVLQTEDVVCVRYIAVDAPEPDQPDGPRATELNRLLVENKIVYLELDDNWWDCYERLLAYVYLDKYGYLMVNMMLVATPMVGVRFYDKCRYEDILNLSDAQKCPECSGPAAPDLDVLEITSPVDAGGVARLKIKTTPGASCTARVSYLVGEGNVVFPLRKELGPEIAGPDGIVEFSFIVSHDFASHTGSYIDVWISATLCETTYLLTSIEVKTD